MIDFLESRHEYRVRGRVLPSVTRILVGMGLLHTVDDEAALQRGRAAHEACRMWDMKTLIARSVDPSIEGYLESWKALRSSKKFRIISFERKVASVRCGYAGRYDRDVYMDDERSILELKTGEIQELAVRLQLAAYAGARRQELSRPSKKNQQFGRIAVRLFPDGAMAHMVRYRATSYARDLAGFLSALNLYRLKEAIQ